MKLSEKLMENHSTPYQMVAREFKVSVQYVAKIARGERIPKRNSGKGMKILEEIKRICKERETKV